QPRLLDHGPGERPALVSEQLALEELVCHRSAMHVEEGLLAPRAPLVYSPRHDPFPGAGLSQDHYLGVAHGCLLGEFQNRPDRRAFAHEFGWTRRRQHAPERSVLPPQPAMLHRTPEGLLDQRRLHGLPEVVERTQLHGCDTVVIVWLPGEDHHLAREARLSETPERFEAAEPW